MTDLDRLGLALVGFMVAVIVAGVLLGLIGRLIKGGKSLLAGVMTVLTPLPAAAWAKVSPICSRGKRAVTSRLTPSLGMRASARRKAVPRPKAPRILISRKWVSQRSRGTWTSGTPTSVRSG